MQYSGVVLAFPWEDQAEYRDRPLPEAGNRLPLSVVGYCNPASKHARDRRASRTCRLRTENISDATRKRPSPTYLPSHVMLSAHGNQQIHGQRGEVFIKKEPLDHFGIQAISATYWPRPDMSTVQAPLESRARGEDASEDQPHTYVPPADPTVYTHEDHADSHIATERDRSGRPKRKRITPEQLDALLGLFQQTDTPSYEQRERVAVHLGMSNREVQVWFQNRRAKERNVKQKQQLMEHRERLERVESASNASDSTLVQQFFPDLPAGPAALSSPARPISDRMPQAFDPTRRRSLSTSALDFPPSTAPNFPVNTSLQSHAEAYHPLPFGPMRPRFNRNHTNQPQYAFGRPSSARSEVPSSRSPPTRLRHLSYTGTASTSTEMLGNYRPELMLPLPQPRYRFEHNSTSSFNTSRPSSSHSGTIADRRENRLPPIRMLLDIADGALADLSPSSLGMPSSQSCSIYSPFSDLQLNTPGSQDGRRVDYFSERLPEVSRGDGEPVASPQYTFGRNF